MNVMLIMYHSNYFESEKYIYRGLFHETLCSVSLVLHNIDNGKKLLFVFFTKTNRVCVC